MEKIIEDFNQKSVEQNIRKKLCGFVTHPGGEISHTNILKKWNLMDVKIFRDLFTKQVNSVDEVNDGNLNSILKNTVNKFNQEVDEEKKMHKPETTYGDC